MQLTCGSKKPLSVELSTLQRKCAPTSFKAHKRIFITGAPRSGTSMLLYMVSGLANVFLWDGEHHPQTLQRLDGHCAAICAKQPLGLALDVPHDYETPEKICPQFSISAVFNYGWNYVVAIVRDPRDSLTSKHKTGAYWTPFVEDFTSDSQVAMYRFALEQIVKHIGNESCFVVRYEDLVRQPRLLMHDIARFLSIRYSHYSIYFDKARIKHELSAALGGARPIETSRIGRWRNPEHKQRLAETWGRDSALRELAFLFGYK